MRFKYFLLPLLLWQHCYAGKIPNTYDAYITEACKLYLEKLDCDWYKALLYTESLLNPNATSQVGAAGIAQIMPGTWAENAPKVNGATDPYKARASIRVGAFFLMRMILFWDDRRPGLERAFLGMASYNAGPGNILKAQRKCNQARTWAKIQPCLVKITGRHSKETTEYVDRIKTNFCRIKIDKGQGIWGLQYFRDNCNNLFSLGRKR